ncbi:MAG: D-amino-acid oxidase [Rhizobiales bacterium]|nr:D-amino-acid oxidase [Hyphomicrobiales bacterium]MBA67723.1 D-amino-acid oxidase [Hyphomicrobiales bacterium]
MSQADRQLAPFGQISADLVVVGAGVAGLWTALKALRAGLSVVLVEKDAVGAGASGGFMGALMPHMPERWDGKKQFQFDALCALEEEAARLEVETGLPVHYRRVGRLTPLVSLRQRGQAEARVEAANSVWSDRFAYNLPAAEAYAEWLDVEQAPLGVVFDDLSARISPVHLLAALKAALYAHASFQLVEGEAAGIDAKAGSLKLAEATQISFGNLVIAAGLGAFPLIEGLTGSPAGALGNPVKGQAALFEADELPAAANELPVIFADGVYVIAHGDGTLAVGATSETEFSEPFSTDEKLDSVIEKARALSPAMRNARLIRRWAGLRPRPAGRDPMLGEIPDSPGVFAIAGGYKITFGIAHHMADAVLASLGATGGPDIPVSFAVGAHIAKSRSRAS